MITIPCALAEYQYLIELALEPGIGGKMNRKVIWFIFIVICFMSLFLLFRYAGNKSVKGTFEIYLYRDTEGHNREEGRKLDETPVVTEKDIKKYHWKDHRIEFTKEYLDKHKSDIDIKDVNYNGGSRILGAKDFDRAIVMVNGKKIYETRFPYAARRAFKNTSELVIRDLELGNSIEIVVNNKGRNGDIRNNKDLYEVLKGLGVLVE